MNQRGEKNIRAADVVVDALEAKIMSGELENNKPLPAERTLMDEYGSSRTVIREAISVLSNRGLVESRPRFRPVVRKPGFQTVLNVTDAVVRNLLAERDGVENLYESRVFVERGLVRIAAEKANKDDIRALKEALQANERVISDSPEFYKTDIAFHGALYQIPRNPIFNSIHQGFVAWLSPRWSEMVRSPEKNELNYLAHLEIYNAILERDPDAAEAALNEHLASAWEDVKTTFE